MSIGESKMQSTLGTADQICCGTTVMNKKMEMWEPGVLLDSDCKSEIYVLLVKSKVNWT